MIHDGDYYSIFDKEKIIPLLDEIEQKIIWMCHQNFIWHNIILSRYLGQDPDTPAYMEELSGKNISHVRHSKVQQEDSTAVIYFGCIKWNIDDVAT